MQHPEAMIGPGKFQWNFAGWFGCSVGSVAFLVPVAGFLLVHGDFALALLTSISFLTSLLLAVVLWRSRQRRLPFPAMMTLFGIDAILVAAVWLSVTAFANPATLKAMSWPEFLPVNILVCLIIPIAMLLFWNDEASETRKKQLAAKKRSRSKS